MSGRLAMKSSAPPIVAELIDVIGEAAYMQLASAMGGGMFRVPRTPGPDHPITIAVGAEKAAAIAEYFHGLQLVLPVREWRRRAILAMADDHSGDEIATKLRIARSYVYEVLAELKRAREPDPYRLDL